MGTSLRVRKGRQFGGPFALGEKVDKPFKTIDELIDLLESRGVKTDDMTRRVLEREGYYPVVNGYKDPFIDGEASLEAGDDRYRESVSFDDIYNLFSFDRELRLLLMRYLTKAEATLKTACAYEFTRAHPDEVNPYLSIDHYAENKRAERFAGNLIEDFKKAIGLKADDSQWKRKSYLEHYVEKHGGEVPLWVLMNYLTLGQTFKFFDFQQDRIKNEIARSFSSLYAETHKIPRKIHARKLRLAYDHIKDFRNICAHDERLYCAKVSRAKDIKVARVIDDLELVLTSQDHKDLVDKVGALTLITINELQPYGTRILNDMGFEEEEILRRKQ